MQLPPGAVVAWAVVSQYEVTLWLIELYYFSRPSLLFIPYEYDLEWLSYGQLSPGPMVAWAVVSSIWFQEYSLETLLRQF